MLAIDKSGVNDFFRGHSTALHLAANKDQAESMRLLVIKVSCNGIYYESRKSSLQIRI